MEVKGDFLFQLLEIKQQPSPLQLTGRRGSSLLPEVGRF